MAAPSPRWDPWDAARARVDLEVRLHPVAALLGGAFLAEWGGRAVIVLDPDLSGPRRRVALAHELVHLERGGGCDHRDAPDGWSPVVSREEAAVADEVARRLVPLAELTDRDPQSLTVAAVAVEFEVDGDTALRALELLRGARRRRRRQRRRVPPSPS